eukprot:TRINITY_DN2797_c0_g1_i1.p2 TRINITY_DN2797_c0_g1~~TRINITY_DN2797_c0_g1_i1.p2  ORF type:complete len:122 (+),score=22.70 TRINITY_DN2797_c0_g1_i1:117-482(+)
MASRARVLNLYRQILRTGYRWQALEPQQTQAEREYILSQARQLFHSGKNVSAAEAETRIKEAEARLELAVHYHNPYPRMMNAAPGAVAKAKRLQKRQEAIRKQAIPLYLQSLQLDSEKSKK